jgi:hypothetical protein
VCVGASEEGNLPVTTAPAWQRGRDFGVAECIGAELLAAVGTIPLRSAGRHLCHADAFEVEPLFVALLELCEYEFLESSESEKGRNEKENDHWREEAYVVVAADHLAERDIVADTISLLVRIDFFFEMSRLTVPANDTRLLLLVLAASRALDIRDSLLPILGRRDLALRRRLSTHARTSRGWSSQRRLAEDAVAAAVAYRAALVGLGLFGLRFRSWHVAARGAGPECN